MKEENQSRISLEKRRIRGKTGSVGLPCHRHKGFSAKSRPSFRLLSRNSRITGHQYPCTLQTLRSDTQMKAGNTICPGNITSWPTIYRPSSIPAIIACTFTSKLLSKQCKNPTVIGYRGLRIERIIRREGKVNFALRGGAHQIFQCPTRDRRSGQRILG
jgi:hypothetical protein